MVAGQVIADTREAVTLREASYAPVHYVPRKDVDMTALVRSAHVTFCPYKGDCAYFSIPIGGERSLNAVWTYEAPYPAAAEIRGISRSIPNASIPSRSGLRPEWEARHESEHRSTEQGHQRPGSGSAVVEGRSNRTRRRACTTSNPEFIHRRRRPARAGLGLGVALAQERAVVKAGPARFAFTIARTRTSTCGTTSQPEFRQIVPVLSLMRP